MRKFQDDPNLAKALSIGAKAEPFILGFILLGFVAAVQHWPIPRPLFIISCTTLSMYYFFKGLAAVASTSNIFIRFVVRTLHWALAIGLIAFLFNIQNWPGWEQMGVVAITTIMLCFLFLVSKGKAITEFLGIFELCSLLLILIYLGKIYYAQLMVQ